MGGVLTGFIFGKIVSALLLPPVGPLLLALWGVWLARRHPRTGRSVAVLAIVGLMALSLPPVADSLLHSLEDQIPVASDALLRAQAIVVLGGGSYPSAPEYENDTVNRWTLERLRYAVYLQKRLHLPILVAGGAPWDGRAEAEAMKEAIERDFGGAVQWSETASRDTAGNAAGSAVLLKAAGISGIALVSHAWHLPRAKALFDARGIEVLPAPTGFSTRQHTLLAKALPSAASLEKSSIALHEWLGILVQNVRSSGFVNRLGWSGVS